MPPKAGYSTPMLHVMDVSRSIGFYQLLGFDLIDSQGDPPGWARMHCEGGAIMFLLAEHPIGPEKHATMLYMYTADLPALREHLVAHGLTVPSICYPEYMKSGELFVKDPDGNAVFVGHWGEKEHSAWLEHLERRRSGGQ